MFKGRNVDIVISDIVVISDFLNGNYVKICCHRLDSHSVDVIHVPVRKVRVCSLPCDGSAFIRFGSIRRLYVTPMIFDLIKFGRRK